MSLSRYRGKSTKPGVKAGILILFFMVQYCINLKKYFDFSKSLMFLYLK